MNWSRADGKQCADLDEWISAYADRQTTPADSEAVEAHLASCVRCETALRRQQRTKRLLRLSSDDSWTPPDLRLLIAHRVAEDRRPSRRPPWVLGLAACLVCAMLIGAFSLGADSPWRSATSVPGLQTAPDSTNSLAPPSAAACAHASGRVLARCLGISLNLLPTLLAEEQSDQATTSASSTQVIHPPLQYERHSLAPAITGILPKGGGIEEITLQGRHGLIPM